MPNSQKKKKKNKEILEVWTTLKNQILKTLTELKANHKDNWALVKNKSVPVLLKILPPHQLEKLKGDLEEKKSLLHKMEQRSSNQIFSSIDQAKRDQLTQAIQDLQSEIAWQELIAQQNWQDLLKTRIALFEAHRRKEITNQITRDLSLANEKIDQLTDKLNWLRTLVRAGDIQQLQELVRQAKI